jgi:hypothetical protein
MQLFCLKFDALCYALWYDAQFEFEIRYAKKCLNKTLKDQKQLERVWPSAKPTLVKKLKTKIRFCSFVPTKLDKTDKENSFKPGKNEQKMGEAE